MTVSVLLARALVEAVVEAGVAQEHFLATAEFDPVRMERPDGRMSLEEYDTLIDCALSLTGDEAFGLRVSERIQGASHQLIAHLVVSSGTLRDGLDALFRFHRLVTDRTPWKLEERDAEARLTYDLTSGPAQCRRFRAELVMAGFFGMVRYFRRDARFHLVAFEHPAPAYRSRYTRIFDGAERFEQSFTGLVFDRELLSAMQLHGDAELHRALEVQAEARTARLGRQVSYAERVGECLLHGATSRGHEHEHGHEMEDVARTLGLSVRTLRRRLQEEGVTFSGVANAAFAALAKRLLVDEARSVEETAYAMGFSAPTSFHRAFKRWTGTTPKEFRLRHFRAAAE